MSERLRTSPSSVNKPLFGNTIKPVLAWAIHESGSLASAQILFAKNWTGPGTQAYPRLHEQSTSGLWHTVQRLSLYALCGLSSVCVRVAHDGIHGTSNFLNIHGIVGKTRLFNLLAFKPVQHKLGWFVRWVQLNV